MRPLGFEYRSKLASPAWRNAWDWVLFVSGCVPMIIYGAAIGNMLLGVPFHFDWDLTSHYTGSFISLLSPFAVLCGLLSLSLSIYMGGVMLTGRTEGAMQQRAQKAAGVAVNAALVLFIIGGVWVSHLQGFVLQKSPAPDLAQTPMQQTVSLATGAWFGNYHAHPVLWLLPALGYLGMVLGWFAIRTGRSTLAWWLGALAWIGVIATAGVGLFPFMMTSSSDPSQSLTVWNSISSARTLLWMTGFTVVFVPLILAYTSWVFYVMRGKVKTEQIDGNSHSY